jgi:hypothetical protein
LDQGERGGVSPLILRPSLPSVKTVFEQKERKATKGCIMNAAENIEPSRENVEPSAAQKEAARIRLEALFAQTDAQLRAVPEAEFEEALEEALKEVLHK